MHAQRSTCRADRFDCHTSPAAQAVISLPEPRNRPGASRQPAALPRRCSVMTACAAHTEQSSWGDDSTRRSEARWQTPLACLAAMLLSGAVPAP